MDFIGQDRELHIFMENNMLGYSLLDWTIEKSEITIKTENLASINDSEKIETYGWEDDNVLKNKI